MKEPIQPAGDGSPTLEVAKYYLEQGLVPLPILPNRKVPAEKGWSKKAVPTTDELARWWSQGSKMNVGIRTGKISGIIVLDVDKKHSGDQTYDALVDKYGKMPDTPIAITPSGGFHVYLAIDPGISIGNSVCKLGAGIDVRGDGGQVVAPPSKIDGKEYFWDGEQPKKTDIAPCPEWLLELIHDARKVEKEDKKKDESIKRNGVIYVSGSRNDQLFRVAAGMRGRGMAQEAIEAALLEENKHHCYPPLPDDEVRIIAQSAQRYDPTPAYENIWKDDLVYQMNGTMKGTKSNLALIFANDERFAGAFRWNTFQDRAETSRDIPTKKIPGPIEEQYYLILRSWFSNRRVCGYRMQEPSPSAMEEAIKEIAYQNPYNPLQTWLKELKWDGLPRIDTWMSDVFGVEPDDYHKACGKILTIGAVKRAMRPGCDMRYMVMLQGTQQIGKSYSLKKLYGDWYAEKASSSFDGTNAMMEMQGFWGIEVAELNAFSRTDINAMKSFVSRTYDVYRPPYGTHVITKPRSSILIGTTNEDMFLRDETGNSRYLPVRCDDTIDLFYLDCWREQLFAEAMVRIDEDITISGAVQAIAIQKQVDAFIVDPWEEVIVDYIDEHMPLSLRMKDLLTNVVGVDTGRQTRSDETRVGKILNRLGWVSVQIRIDNGKRMRIYKKMGAD